MTHSSMGFHEMDDRWGNWDTKVMHSIGCDGYENKLSGSRSLSAFDLKEGQHIPVECQSGYSADKD